MNKEALKNLNSGRSSGTSQYYHIPQCESFVYTDGVKDLATWADAYWLITAISSHQGEIRRKHPEVIRGDRQIWTLKEFGSGAILECRTYDRDIVAQTIPYTDFPFECFKNRQVTIAVACGSPDGEGSMVAALPSEG